MKLDESKTRASINIQQTLDADGLDNLMRQLAQLRATMTPAVPDNRRQLALEDDLLIEDRPSMEIALRQVGGFRLWTRHTGFGWIAYQIDEQTAHGIASYILAKLAGTPTGGLVPGGLSQRH